MQFVKTGLNPGYKLKSAYEQDEHKILTSIYQNPNY